MSVQSLDFLHRLNDGGLLFLNHYLEEVCGCRVFHISPTDRLIYDGDDRDTAERLKARIMSRPQSADFSYDAVQRFMIYRYHVNELRNLFVFYPVEPDGTDRILACLDEINSPVVFSCEGCTIPSCTIRHCSKTIRNRSFSRTTATGAPSWPRA